jgi:hypothetical protein
MKKNILFLFIGMMGFLSCQRTVRPDTENLGHDVMYFKDTITNLCYASIASKTYGGMDVVSITCVPCDSLKKVLH